MSEETKKALEELEAIRLKLFRSAASLDQTIKQIELIMGDPVGKVGEVGIAWMMQYRMEQLRVCGWDKLKERETEAWRKLLDSIEVKEES